MRIKKLTTALLILTVSACANSRLTPDLRLSSEVLGYDLQYRVYLPDDYESKEKLPVLYVTDGPSYIKNGRVPRLLDRLIESEQIEPIIVVFVDPRDPDDLDQNRRSRQFACNADYLKFYSDELILTIEQEYPVATNRDKRSILGVSFGGLNAACFGLMGHEVFSGIGMQSPANHLVSGLLSAYEKAPTLPLEFFLTTGAPYDNTLAIREFSSLLRDKGYELEYIEVAKERGWENWKPLIDDVLFYFYKRMGES